MPEEIKVQLVDAYGKPLKHQFAPAADRAQIATKVYYYFSTQPEVQDFLTEILIKTVDTQISDAENLQISIDSQKFQKVCLDYAAESVINAALDEDLSKAYSMLLHFSDLPLYQNLNEEEPEVTDKELAELNVRLTNTPELVLAKDVCDIQSEIAGFLNGDCQKSITSFQANRIQEKFEDITPFLNFEQRAAGYYNISIIHRALLLEKNSEDINRNNAEKDCLKKVLEYTSDYKRINYCVNRLDDSFTDKGVIRAAYRRALKVTNMPNDLYKINVALAQCYLDDYRPRVGFKTSQQNTLETDKLEKAVYHYQEALRFAKKPERLGLLKNIAKLQLKPNKLQNWTETETLIAMKYLQAEERCHALMEVASRNKDLQREYLEQALNETIHSKKINKARKKILLQKISHHLRLIYTQNNDKENTQKLENILKTYAVENVTPINPLLKYKKSSRQK